MTEQEARNEVEQRIRELESMDDHRGPLYWLRRIVVFYLVADLVYYLLKLATR